MTKKEIKHFHSYLLTWYQIYQRKLPWRNTKDPYRIWISEVMLQQTQVNTVIPYYKKFLKSFPTLKDLAQSNLDYVLKIWEGLGYYARARNLHKAAKFILHKYDGIIPNTFDEFRKLSGVGDYIASAVQSIVFGNPYAVVDGNVKRVLSRLFSIKNPVNHSVSRKIFQEKADYLLDLENPGNVNQAMMELGALICTPRNPDCGTCPVQQFCIAYKNNRVSEYPKRIKKKSVPTYHIVTGVVYKNGKILITRRKPEGLLGGLWEFPGGKLKKGEDTKTACIREIREETGIIAEIDNHITQVKHAYTHFKIIMDVFCCKYISGKIHLNGPIDFRWVKLNEINDFAFPKANHKFIHLLD